MYLTLELAPGAARKYISNQTRNAILAPVWQKLARKTAAPGSRPKSLMDQMHWRREIHLPVKSNLPLLAARHLYQFWSLGLLVLPNTALRQNSEHKSEDIHIPYSESKVFRSRFQDFYLQYFSKLSTSPSDNWALWCTSTWPFLPCSSPLTAAASTWPLSLVLHSLQLTFVPYGRGHHFSQFTMAHISYIYRNIVTLITTFHPFLGFSLQKISPAFHLTSLPPCVCASTGAGWHWGGGGFWSDTQ